MARRAFAQLYTRIWSDEDFRMRSAAAQRMYMLLLSQPQLTYCGTIPLTLRRWAKCAPDTTPDDIRAALDELAEHRFVVIDEDTDELLVRTFIRNDELWKQPRMLGVALEESLETESPLLRRELAAELRALPTERMADQVERTVSYLLVGDPEPPPEPPPSAAHASAHPAARNGTPREGVPEGSAPAPARAHTAPPPPPSTHTPPSRPAMNEHNPRAGNGGRQASRPVERPAADELNQTATRVESWRIVNKWLQSNPGVTTTQRRKLAKAADELLAQRAEPELIPETLDEAHRAEWRDPVKSMPSAYDRVRRRRYPSSTGAEPSGRVPTTTQRVAAIQALKRGDTA